MYYCLKLLYIFVCINDDNGDHEKIIIFYLYKD